MAIVGILLAATSAAAHAQIVADTIRLEDITVTATRVPVPIGSLTSSVTVLRGEELESRGIAFVLDALRGVPGLNIVQNGSFGATTSLFLRGGESDYAKVLIDGVPANEPGGAFSFANLSTANIDRIEVLRGPASVLYGSDAATGVVQIFTKTGSGRPTVTARGRAGTHGSLNFGADVAGGTPSTSYSFAVDRFVTDGLYEFNNEYDNTLASGRFQVRPDAATDLALTMRYRDSEFHFPTDGAGNLVDANAFALTEATTIGIDAGRFLTDWVEARLLIASNVQSGGTDDSQDGPADTLGFFGFRSLQDLSRQSVDARTNVYIDPGVVITGGVQLEQQEERSFTEAESEFGPSSTSTKVERSNRAYYAQVLTDVAGLSVVAGVRADDSDAFGTFTTYRVGAAYRFPSATKVRASAGRSFKAPTFFENFATGFVTGNPDLEPERSFAWEVGVDQEMFDGRVRVSGTHYRQSFDDLIQFSFVQTPNYSNVAEADASGIEVEVTLTPVRGITLTANYSYLDTEVIDAGFDTGAGAAFVEGNRLLRRPTGTLNLGLTYAGWQRGRLSVFLNHTGDRDDRDFNTFPATPVVLPAYTTVDASAEADVLTRDMAGATLTWTVRVDNLLDESYAQAFGFPARGRAVLIGGRLRR